MALCVRPADCLGGNPFFGAHRGVRAAAAPPRRAVPQPQQQKQQYVQVATTASTSAPGQARGRANGRKRGRRSPRGAGSPAEKRVLENVVILKRGEQNQAKVTAALESAEKAEHVAAADTIAVAAAADQHSAPAEKGETVVAAKQSSAQVEKAEPVAAAADTRAKKAEAADQQRGAGATNAAAKAKVVAAAKQSGGQGTKALYSGPSFAAAPEPRELPIPFLLLKGRGARLRPRDAAEQRAAPTAAAA